MSDEATTDTDERTDATPAAGSLEARVIEAIKTIYDPEIPVNIYELGLIYRIAIDEAAGKVDIDMTLTSPACPVAGSLPPEVQTKIEALEGVNDVAVELVWDPPWSKDLLSEAAKLTLGLG
ncbi:MAG: SUF system Fe-S cluster assembly protein [Planctomycetota bacterium]|nr:SUF system Fe-S cluster assembly protein [Planctomycetota bacterium]